MASDASEEGPECVSLVEIYSQASNEAYSRFDSILLRGQSYHDL